MTRLITGATIPLLTAVLMACTPNAQLSGISTESPTPTATSTAALPDTPGPPDTPEPQSRAARTSTATPGPLTPSPKPEAGTIAGIVRMDADQGHPYPMSLELHAAETFALDGSTTSDSAGDFVFKSIPPGQYELWVLIGPNPTIITGCDDIAVEEDPWRIGIKFGEDERLIMQNPDMTDAISDIDISRFPDLTGIYAVTQLSMAPDAGINVHVPLSCR